jgi:hypothetical protein
MPTEEEIITQKHSISFVNAVIDEPIPAEIFTFVPPADAVDASSAFGISGRGGRGGSFPLPDRKGHFEARDTHEWIGDTLLQRSKLRLHGVNLTLERRLTFSEDRRELKVVETITGPKGEKTLDLSVPLA